MSRHCQNCGNPLRGRIDKKFCDDSCRNSHNNYVGRDTNNNMRRINRMLSKNRRILCELNPTGTDSTTVAALLAKGFNFHLFTGFRETKSGNRYFFCYDQGFTFFSDQRIGLVVKGEQGDLMEVPQYLKPR